MKSSINRQMKDSVFTKLFSKPENLKWMYEELLSEMDVQEKDIKILTLNSAMINGLRNDLAFSVKDEVIILCEAQSSWSENILIRMWLYLSETVKDYLSEHNVSLHQTAKIKMPKIHLFMIYTGNNKHVPKELSLAESFFQGDPSVLDLRIQVLSEAHGTGIVSQYIEFCKIQVECFKKYCTNAETAIKTVFKKCIEKGVLVDFLKKEEQEMEEIMSYLFNEEEERRLYNESLKREFLAEGIAKGEKLGIAKGEKLGIAKGEKLGIAKGEKLGIAKGSKQMRDEMIQTMIAEGAAAEFVCKVGGITEDEYKRLIRNLNINEASVPAGLK